MSRRMMTYEGAPGVATRELETITAPDYTAWQGPALIVGVAGILLTTAFALIYPPLLFRAYLVAFMLPLGISLGSMAILMINRLTGGAWADQLRPILESSARTIPILLLFFVPLQFGIPSLYPWARPDAEFAETAKEKETHKDGEAKSHAALSEKQLDEKHEAERFHSVLDHKRIWLNYPFWLGRAVGYFAIWTLLAYVLVGKIRKLGTSPTVEQMQGLRTLGGVGLAVYGLTMTFAAIDWTMSLEPEWFSTIYAVMLAVGQLLSALSFSVIIANLPALKTGARPEDSPPIPALHDMGNLLLAFTMLWAYMSLCQYLLIYSGNLPEETVWYLRRIDGGWVSFAFALILFQFAVPFFMLLSKENKQTPRVIVGVAVLIFLMRPVDLLWVIGPGFTAHPLPTDAGYTWMLPLVQPFALLGVGGLWLSCFLWQLRQAPATILLPEEPIQEPAHA